MARRKKYPSLPNVFGSIKRLSGNRRNPYAVHPPTTEFTEDGIPKIPKALCYVDDWYIGFAVLTAYKAGNYVPGMEKELKKLKAQESEMNTLIKQILSDYSKIRGDEPEENGLTFTEVYERFYDWKFNGKKEYSKSTKSSTRAAFKNCSVLHNKVYASISYREMQDVLDNCTLKHSSVELIDSLLKQMAKYARAEKIIPDKTNVELLRINIEEDDEHGVPFSNEDLKVFWKHSENEVAEVILIMCYSGYRIGELNVIHVDLKEKSFSGGIKTRTSKERIVPIHSAIFQIVKRRMKKYGCLLPIPVQSFRPKMYEFLKQVSIERHTPHDCRHTFSAMCERYGVRENDRKRMLGHKFNDITNGIYGHRTLEELSKEIEKIKVCY